MFAVECGVDGEDAVDGGEPLKFVQENIAYLGAQKENKNSTEYKNVNGKIRMKIGFTSQSIIKRFSGPKLTEGFEPITRSELNENGCIKSKFKGQSKYKIEIELYKKLVNVEEVEFEGESTEIFLIPFDKRFDIQDMFHSTCRFFRPGCEFV